MADDLAKEGIRTILNMLDESDLIQLAVTTTQYRLKPEIFKNKEDAINAILRYSSDYSIILSRKTVKRDLLFRYLHEHNIAIAQSATKLALIQKILEHWSSPKQTTVSANSPPSAANINEMALKFTEWFYSMLNQNEQISDEHFWNDCSIHLNLISATATVEHNVLSDRSEVTQLLYNTKTEHSLFFNPNLTADGVYGKMDAHGLVMVFACGTLHSKEQCVGVFEQIFSLARDPFAENNWKIKNTRLNLRNKDISEVPKLCDTNFCQELIVTDS